MSWGGITPCCCCCCCLANVAGLSFAPSVIPRGPNYLHAPCAAGYYTTTVRRGGALEATGSNP